jgi:hypothetical protein
MRARPTEPSQSKRQKPCALLTCRERTVVATTKTLKEFNMIDWSGYGTVVDGEFMTIKILADSATKFIDWSDKSRGGRRETTLETINESTLLDLLGMRFLNCAYSQCVIYR